MRNLPSSGSLVNDIMAIKQRYVEGWLVMLRNQCKVLDKKFRVAPKIHDTADEVSEKFVQENGVLDLDERWANKVIKESEEALCQQAGESACRPCSSPISPFQSRGIHLVRNSPYISLKLLS